MSSSHTVYTSDDIGDGYVLMCAHAYMPDGDLAEVLLLV